MTYCDFVKSLTIGNPNYIHKIYHDNEYGFWIDDDNKLFGRLILEINQAGLSWTTILKKHANFIKAYDDFNIEKIASYGEDDIARLLQDAGVIRNRLKIKAAITNANKIIEIQNEHGSFAKWLLLNRDKTKDEWTKLFRKTFAFTGGEIVNEFLMSIGLLSIPHDSDCPIYQKCVRANQTILKNK